MKKIFSRALEIGLSIVLILVMLIVRLVYFIALLVGFLAQVAFCGALLTFVIITAILDSSVLMFIYGLVFVLVCLIVLRLWKPYTFERIFLKLWF